jgi:hypothetical protein
LRALKASITEDGGGCCCGAAEAAEASVLPPLLPLP